MPTRLAHRLGLAAVILGLAAGGAMAQDNAAATGASSSPPLPSDAEGFEGQWVLATDDSTQPTCPINLTDQPASAPSTWVVQALDSCAAIYPAVTTWSVEDGGSTLVLSDSKGSPALSLRENADGLFDNHGSGAGLIFLLAPYEQGNGEQDTD